MTRRETILVTDGDERAALAVVRSLGRQQYRVIVSSATGASLAGASRFASADIRVPDPVAAPEAYARAIGETVERVGARVLLPVSEAALLAILPSPPSGVVLPMPSGDAFRRISDKAELLRIAPAVGIDVPIQREVASRAEARDLADDALQFPLVLKPARSIGESDGRRQKLGVAHVATRDELLHVVGGMDDAAFPLLVQRRIEGPGIGVFLLVWDGQTIAQFCHRRIREKPPSGGVSVYRESIAPQPRLISQSRALLDRFAWQGVAMVEYKVDAATGRAYLMEVNGRFWGSLQLAIDAGVDFPALLVAVATGQPVTPVMSYAAGTRSRWWWGDVDHLIARFRMTSQSPGRRLSERWRALAQFLAYHPGLDREEILRLSDPWPFFRETRRWFTHR